MTMVTCSNCKTGTPNSETNTKRKKSVIQKFLDILDHIPDTLNDKSDVLE